MKNIENFFKTISSKSNHEAIFYDYKYHSYFEINNLLNDWIFLLEKNGIKKGTICAFIADYSPKTCALIFALMKIKAISVPLSKDLEVNEIKKFNEIANTEFLITFNNKMYPSIKCTKAKVDNNLIIDFLGNNNPGLIVFTSGSSGEPKGILHDCEHLMSKFIKKRKGWKTILFLLIDHLGGINTLFSSFAYGGSSICVPDRNPDTVCKIIEKSKADLLPTTPTFINMLIASRVYLKYDLSSIKLITYGTEVMPENTLLKLKEIFPNARLKQTYGLSELGVLRSKSKNDNSLWVKVGGEGFETKILDGFLWVRSHSNMVGYLNAPNPIDKEGWMNTGDQVEVKGEYIRILGRKSELINIGGQKVFPAEIENVILEDDNISDVTVYGKKHPLMGNVLIADVSIIKNADSMVLSEKLRKHCLSKLSKWKVPVRFNISADSMHHNIRYKKSRTQSKID